MSAAASTEISAAGETTEDAALGGRLRLRQPRRGHRFGHDAILLAAATAAQSGERAIELGAGVGAAGLALAHRVDDLAVALIDIDPALVALARDNVAANGLASRVRGVCLDVAAPAEAFATAGVAAGAADRVLMNPPFNRPHNPPPDPERRAARIATSDTLRVWLRAAARLLRASGTVTLIWRADDLDDVLRALAADFGAVAVMPIHAKPGGAAIRVLVRAVKGSNGPMSIAPGLLLADAEGRPTAACDAILRDGAALPWPAD